MGIRSKNLAKREAGVQKRIERAKKWGQESEKCPPVGREQERPACKKVREGKEMGTGEWEMHAGRKSKREARRAKW